MGYLFIIGLIVILATILAITIRFDYKRIKKKCAQALIEAEFWGEMEGRK